MITLVRIVEVSHPRPGWSVIRFENGAAREIEWSRYAKPGTVLARLADPAYAAQCKPVQHGYGLEWPDGMDWSSGAVLKAGRPAHQPVGGPLFKATRRNGSMSSDTARSSAVRVKSAAKSRTKATVKASASRHK